MFEMAKKLWKDEEGLTTSEYALLLALLVVAAISIWTGFGGRVQESITDSKDAFDEATSAASS